MLLNRVKSKRKEILEAWFVRIIETYPDDSHNFFLKKKNQFANPVGTTIEREIAVLFDQLTGEMDDTEIARSLGEIARIRAVQDFEPSRAMGFILELRAVIREAIKEELRGPAALDDLFEFEQRLDTLALCAFDNYMDSRERLHQIRNREIKARSQEMVARIYRDGAERSDNDNEEKT